MQKNCQRQEDRRLLVVLNEGLPQGGYASPPGILGRMKSHLLVSRFTFLKKTKKKVVTDWKTTLKLAVSLESLFLSEENNQSPRCVFQDCSHVTWECVGNASS